MRVVGAAAEFRSGHLSNLCRKLFRYRVYWTIECLWKVRLRSFGKIWRQGFWLRWDKVKMFIYSNNPVSVGTKNQLDATEWFISLIICSTCFGHFYAHHQEFETIQGDSGGICTTLGNDSTSDSKQKSSYEHGPDFERLGSYDRLKLGIEGNDYWQWTEENNKPA